MLLSKFEIFHSTIREKRDCRNEWQNIRIPIFKKFLTYHSITDHELICEERSVTCIFFYCKCICSAKKLPEHLKIKHKKDISRYSEEVIQTTGPLNSTHYLTHMGAGADCFHSSFYVVDHQFKEKPEPSWCVGPFKQGEKKFFQYMYFHVKKGDVHKLPWPRTFNRHASAGCEARVGQIVLIIQLYRIVRFF